MLNENHFFNYKSEEELTDKNNCWSANKKKRVEKSLRLIS